MVNIFITSPDILETARSLDKRRLCKQKLETKQIIDSLEELDRTGTITKPGWSNHPATRSWKGYTNQLKVYFNIITREWVNRGCVNNMPFYDIDESLYNIVPCTFDGKTASYDVSKFNKYSFPFWVSFPPFYMSHRASLCRKDPKYYKAFLCDELIPFLNNGYLWPSNVTSECYTNWSFSHHESLGCGCPAVYRTSIIDVIRWISNPLVNPTTNRRITEKSDIYKTYYEAMIGHNIKVIDSFVYLNGINLFNVFEISNCLSKLQEYINNNGGHPTPAQIVYANC